MYNTLCDYNTPHVQYPTWLLILATRSVYRYAIVCFHVAIKNITWLKSNNLNSVRRNSNLAGKQADKQTNVRSNGDFVQITSQNLRLNVYCLPARWEFHQTQISAWNYENSTSNMYPYEMLLGYIKGYNTPGFPHIVWIHECLFMNANYRLTISVCDIILV